MLQAQVLQTRLRPSALRPGGLRARLRPGLRATLLQDEVQEPRELPQERLEEQGEVP